MNTSEKRPSGGSTGVATQLGSNILNNIQSLVEEAEQATQPLEMAPYRPRLFDLFVMASAADLIPPESEVPAAKDEAAAPEGSSLSADAICRVLAKRSGLDAAAQFSTSSQQKLPAAHLIRMRSLWSVMRMWMEWSYAWQRWAEFHPEPES